MEILDLSDGFLMKGKDYKRHAEYVIRVSNSICIVAKSYYYHTDKNGSEFTMFKILNDCSAPQDNSL